MGLALHQLDAGTVLLVFYSIMWNKIYLEATDLLVVWCVDIHTRTQWNHGIGIY